MSKATRSTGWPSPSGTVGSGTGINATVTFSDLALGSDTSDADYTFRADVVGADTYEGNGAGMDRYICRVYGNPEVRACAYLQTVRTATVS